MDDARTWRRCAESAALVWHRFEADDWAVHDPGLGATHALDVLPAAILTLLETDALSVPSLVDALGLVAGGAEAVALALLELEARGLIERV